MVALGTTRDNPDYYAIEVFNEAFGGGFSSRLFRDIRTAKGLAYSVGGGIGTRFDHPGYSACRMGTKSTTTVESIQALFARDRSTLQRSQSPKTKSSAPKTRSSIPSSSTSTLRIKFCASAWPTSFYGYPADFLERYRAGIEKVTPRTWPGSLPSICTKTNWPSWWWATRAEFDKPLTSLGTVSNVDITIPPPPGEPEAPKQ